MIHSTLFNSTLETGIRALILLNATYPKALDLNTLTLLDHLVVHTADIGGPKSLHPTTPQRTGEILVRRMLIVDSIVLMRRIHLVIQLSDATGISYQATDDAEPFVDLLRSDYANQLKNRAKWIAEYVSNLSTFEIRKLMKNKVERWSTEFQPLYLRTQNST